MPKPMGGRVEKRGQGRTRSNRWATSRRNNPRTLGGSSFKRPEERKRGPEITCAEVCMRKREVSACIEAVSLFKRRICGGLRTSLSERMSIFVICAFHRRCGRRDDVMMRCRARTRETTETNEEARTRELFVGLWRVHPICSPIESHLNGQKGVPQILSPSQMNRSNNQQRALEPTKPPPNRHSEGKGSVLGRLLASSRVLIGGASTGRLLQPAATAFYRRVAVATWSRAARFGDLV